MIEQFAASDLNKAVTHSSKDQASKFFSDAYSQNSAHLDNSTRLGKSGGAQLGQNLLNFTPNTKDMAGTSLPELKLSNTSLFEGTVNGDSQFHEQLRKKVLESMSEEQRKQYAHEDKQLEDYRHECAKRDMLITISPPPYPEAPKTPAHQEVGRRIRILDGVMAQHENPSI